MTVCAPGDHLLARNIEQRLITKVVPHPEDIETKNGRERECARHIYFDHRFKSIVMECFPHLRPVSTTLGFQVAILGL